MTKFFLAAGVAALALTAAPASAQHAGDKQKGHAAKAQRGAAAAQTKRRTDRQATRVERRAPAKRVAVAESRKVAPKPVARAQKVERRAPAKVAVRERIVARKSQPQQRVAARVETKPVAKRVAARVETKPVAKRVEARQDKRQQQQRVETRVQARQAANRIEARQANRIEARRDDRRADVRVANRAVVRDARNDRVVVKPVVYRAPVRIVNVVAPYASRRYVGRAIPAAYRQRLLPVRLRTVYRDTPDYYYRYGDGYMYRVNRRDNLIAALLPLLGAGYGIGQQFPTSYMNSYVPSYYSSFYPDTSSINYRYANGYVYGVDPYSGLIQNTAPAYGYGYGVGQMLPSSYSYYNVPYQYRSTYYDTPNSYYRYAPGAIYQVDRSTSLITAVASLLSGGMSVGQPLPLGYDAYNVPYAYRDRYYDTPNSIYRYSNGNIYQIDPTTRLVSALVQAIV